MYCMYFFLSCMHAHVLVVDDSIRMHMHVFSCVSGLGVCRTDLGAWIACTYMYLHVLIQGNW